MLHFQIMMPDQLKKNAWFAASVCTGTFFTAAFTALFYLVNAADIGMNSIGIIIVVLVTFASIFAFFMTTSEFYTMPNPVKN